MDQGGGDADHADHADAGGDVGVGGVGAGVGGDGGVDNDDAGVGGDDDGGDQVAATRMRVLQMIHPDWNVKKQQVGSFSVEGDLIFWVFT